VGDLAVRVGDLLIIGLIEYGQIRCAKAAWPLRTARNVRFGRKSVIIKVSPTGAFAQIVTEGSGKRVFVHASQLQRGAALRVGSRLTFIEADNGRGPAAYDVQIAK
jgi:cold shock CspA family protein